MAKKTFLMVHTKTFLFDSQNVTIGGMKTIFLKVKREKRKDKSLLKHILKKKTVIWVHTQLKKCSKVSLLAHNQTSAPKKLLVWWIYQFQSRMCVLVLHDGLLQEQLAAPRHDGQLVLHVETHQVADTQEHLIMGPHLHTHMQKHTCGGFTCDQQPFCSACADTTSSTCPCASTSSRWRTVPPSTPLRTYWPEAELLSLTRKSPLQLSRDSACSRPNLRPRI